VQKNLVYYVSKTFEEILVLIEKCGVPNLEVYESTAFYCLTSKEAMGLMDKVYVAQVNEEVEDKQEEVEQVEHKQEEMKDEDEEISRAVYTGGWW
jgi:vacuolar-type H+-ATPase subunit I/STV1